jgi:hypothetical protein
VIPQNGTTHGPRADGNKLSRALLCAVSRGNHAYPDALGRAFGLARYAAHILSTTDLLRALEVACSSGRRRFLCSGSRARERSSRRPATSGTADLADDRDLAVIARRGAQVCIAEDW